MSDDPFGFDEPFDIKPILVPWLRSQCCDPDEPWVDPNHHDHGHTGCYFMNEAADEIERLRSDRWCGRDYCDCCGGRP